MAAAIWLASGSKIHTPEDYENVVEKFFGLDENSRNRLVEVQRRNSLRCAIRVGNVESISEVVVADDDEVA